MQKDNHLRSEQPFPTACFQGIAGITGLCSPKRQLAQHLLITGQYKVDDESLGPMVNVRREAPDQRLHHRLTAPLMVGTPAGTFKAFDWSLGGVGLENYPEKVKVGEKYSWEFHIPFQGFDVSFTSDVEIRHTNDQGRIGVCFKDMGEREIELLSHFADSLVRGSMTTVDDTILHIDMPVTPVSTEPDPNPNEEVPLRRRSLKVLFYSAAYITVGFAIIAYLGMVIYTNFWRLEVESAVVSASLQPIFATSDGRVINVSVNPNTALEQDTPMITIDDPELRQAIAMAEIKIDRSMIMLLTAQKELDAEHGRAREYRIIALSQLEQIKARIRSLEKQTQLAMEQVGRLSELKSDSWTSNVKRHEAEAKYAVLQGELEQAIILQRERSGLIEDLSAGRFFSGNKLEGRTAELQAAVDLHWEDVRCSKDELLALERKRERLVLAAPAAGQLVKLLKPRGTNVVRGERIALFERDEARTIDAFLTQEELLEIGMGDRAVIYFPSLDQRADAIILGIDRTSGFIDEIQSQYQWRGPEDRSARVKLGFLDIPDAIVRKLFSPGLPAVVIFERRRTGRQHNWINADPVMPLPLAHEPEKQAPRGLSI